MSSSLLAHVVVIARQALVARAVAVAGAALVALLVRRRLHLGPRGRAASGGAREGLVAAAVGATRTAESAHRIVRRRLALDVLPDHALLLAAKEIGVAGVVRIARAAELAARRRV